MSRKFRRAKKIYKFLNKKLVQKFNFKTVKKNMKFDNSSHLKR